MKCAMGHPAAGMGARGIVMTIPASSWRCRTGWPAASNTQPPPVRLQSGSRPRTRSCKGTGRPGSRASASSTRTRSTWTKSCCTNGVSGIGTGAARDHVGHDDVPQRRGGIVRREDAHARRRLPALTPGLCERAERGLVLAEGRLAAWRRGPCRTRCAGDLADGDEARARS